MEKEKTQLKSSLNRDGFCKQTKRPSPDKTLRRSVAGLSGLLLSASLLISCLPEPLEVNNIPVIKPVIVVSAQIVPDSTLLVVLTKSFSALDAGSNTDPEDLLDMIAINDAIVTVTGAGRTDTLNFLEKGLYGDIRIPFQEGDFYELHVSSETMGEVRAGTIVQPRVKFEEVEARLYLSNYNDTLAQITYSFFDPEESNWYMVNVQEVEQEDAIRNAINPGAYTVLFEDTHFQDKVREEQFRVTTRDYAPGDTIAVSLSNISKDYHSFMKLRLDNRLSFIEFLSEPINYPSNIEGGKGFFNLYVPDIRTFVLEEDF